MKRRDPEEIYRGFRIHWDAVREGYKAYCPRRRKWTCCFDGVSRTDSLELLKGWLDQMEDAHERLEARRIARLVASQPEDTRRRVQALREVA